MNKGHLVAEEAVVFERTLPASPEKCWAFLTETSRLAEWYGDGAIEPREGGKVNFMSGHIRGVVTGWRPGQFLAYTWNVFAPGENVSGWPVSYLEFALASPTKAAPKQHFAAMPYDAAPRPARDDMDSYVDMLEHVVDRGFVIR